MTFPMLTIEVIDGLVAAGGNSWWLRGETYLANDAEWTNPEVEGDLYILDASDAWLSQFEGDWQALADQVNPLLARHNDL